LKRARKSAEFFASTTGNTPAKYLEADEEEGMSAEVWDLANREEGADCGYRLFIRTDTSGSSTRVQDEVATGATVAEGSAAAA
jgi:hypothetical protein